MKPGPGLKCLCGNGSFDPVFRYDAPPPGENRFPLSPDTAYRREVVRCLTCGHFLSLHGMDLTRLYAGDYVASVYGRPGLRQAYERVRALPPDNSDNRGRVARVIAFAVCHFGGGPPRSILDVGSGLCVFPAAIEEAGWDATALDPDPGVAAHARDTVGVKVLCGDFLDVPASRAFDAVSFNKVLEHVEEPVSMLHRALLHLASKGFVYVEVPDGEAAVADGSGREEFFIEHHHAFSAASLAVLAARAGFELREMERLREPSGKYTLRAFLTRGDHLR